MITVTVLQVVLGLVATAVVAAVLTALALYTWRRRIAAEARYIRQWVKNAEDLTAWTRQVPDEASTVARRHLATGARSALTAAADLVRIAAERTPWSEPTGRHRTGVA